MPAVAPSILPLLDPGSMTPPASLRASPFISPPLSPELPNSRTRLCAFLVVSPWGPRLGEMPPPQRQEGVSTGLTPRPQASVPGQLRGSCPAEGPGLCWRGGGGINALGMGPILTVGKGHSEVILNQVQVHSAGRGPGEGGAASGTPHLELHVHDKPRNSSPLLLQGSSPNLCHARLFSEAAGQHVASHQPDPSEGLSPSLQRGSLKTGCALRKSQLALSLSSLTRFARLMSH